MGSTCSALTIPVYANIYNDATDMVSKINDHIIDEVHLCDGGTFAHQNVRFYDAGTKDYQVNFDYLCDAVPVQGYTATSRSVKFGPRADVFPLQAAGMTDKEVFDSIPVSGGTRSVPSSNAWWQQHVAKYSSKTGTEFEQHRAYTLYNFTKNGIAHEVRCADVIDASECTSETLILPAIDYVAKTIDLQGHPGRIIYIPMLILNGVKTTYEVTLPDSAVINVDIYMHNSQKTFKIHGHSRFTFHSGQVVAINHKYKLKFGSMTVHRYHHHLMTRWNLHVTDNVARRDARRREAKHRQELLNFEASRKAAIVEEPPEQVEEPPKPVEILSSPESHEEVESVGVPPFVWGMVGILMVSMSVVFLLSVRSPRRRAPPSEPAVVEVVEESVSSEDVEVVEGEEDEVSV